MQTEEISVMKPMVYQSQRIYECLYEGYYKDYHFAILSLGTHPCAYIEIPKDHKYYGKRYNNIDIACHWDVTYSRNGLGTGIVGFYRTGYWIGWDYSHYGDYAGYEVGLPSNLRTGGKKWTTEEIYEEVKDVIEQLMNND